MLRNELDQDKRRTVWDELCAIICCGRSRAYLNNLLVKFDEKEKEYRERKRLEEEKEQELLENQPNLSSRRNEKKPEKKVDEPASTEVQKRENDLLKFVQ